MNKIKITCVIFALMVSACSSEYDEKKAADLKLQQLVQQNQQLQAQNQQLYQQVTTPPSNLQQAEQAYQQPVNTAPVIIQSAPPQQVIQGGHNDGMLEGALLGGMLGHAIGSSNNGGYNGGGYGGNSVNRTITNNTTIIKKTVAPSVPIRSVAPISSRYPTIRSSSSSLSSRSSRSFGRRR